MALYTLIRNIEVENPRHQLMIEKSVSPGVSSILLDEIRVNHVYSSEEEAAKDAEYWNSEVEGANLIPAKVALSGRIKYRTGEFFREFVQDMNNTPTHEDLSHMYFVAFGALGAGFALKAGLEQVLNKIDPSFTPKEQLVLAGFLGLVSLGSYLLRENEKKDSQVEVRQ